MNHEDDVRDLLAPWALDAVDDLERARVERAIDTDPELALEARALRETVGRLAAGVAAPAPAHLRKTVLDSIEVSPQETLTKRPRHAWPRWVTAAAAVVLLGVPSGIAYQQHQHAEQAEQQLATISSVLNQPGARLLEATASHGGRVVAVVASGGDTLVSMSNVPALVDHDYQLWVIDAAGPSSAGILRAAGSTMVKQLLDVPAGASLAITVEPKGGSPQPTTDPVAVIKT